MGGCRNCYYCNDDIKIGGSWWCACSNPGRSPEASYKGHNWVRSRLNLACWTEPIRVVYEFENPPPKVYELKRIRKKTFLHSYIDKPRDVKVPWHLLIRSRVTQLISKVSTRRDGSRLYTVKR